MPTISTTKGHCLFYTSGCLTKPDHLKHQVFETHYNEEMEREVQRLEAKKRAADAGHPEWDNACITCGCELIGTVESSCENCR